MAWYNRTGNKLRNLDRLGKEKCIRCSKLLNTNDVVNLNTTVLKLVPIN